jgi:hypothetical protein
LIINSLSKLKITLVFMLVISSSNIFANKSEFITSVTYGVLAGTLVGAASLAFTDQPGENLQMVARGASLGLYAGIALGFYVMSLNSAGDLDELDLPPEEEGEYDEEASFAPKAIAPIIASNGRVDGAIALWQLYRF